MFRRTRLAACTTVIAALAVPVGMASAAPPPVIGHVGSITEFMPGYGSTLQSPNPGVPALPPNPQCPANYSGPVNLATGCPWYLMH
jgi:hypothetical protein